MAATRTTTATLADEHRALTEKCGLLDRSERGKLALTGAGAAEFLNGQVTNDVAALRAGEGCYAAFLTHKGKMLGDLRILAVAQGDDSEAGAPGRGGGDGTRFAPDGRARPVELLLDTERASLQALFDMIRRFQIGHDVELHKRTLQSALLSLVGPDAGEVAARAMDGDPVGAGREGAGREGVDRLAVDRLLSAREHGHAPARLDGTPVRLIRTDVGIDVLCDSAAAHTVRDALERAGARPVSERAAEIVRVERGRPRYGIDVDDATIPQEAGLNERAVSFTKGCYVGQETVARLHYKGKPNRLLRGLALSEPVAPGAELLLGERVVGRLTSSVLSPAFGPIGLALVRVQAEPGMTVAVGESGAAGLVRDGRVAPPSAVVCELPFQQGLASGETRAG